jgi:hypothetical protein
MEERKSDTIPRKSVQNPRTAQGGHTVPKNLLSIKLTIQICTLY